MDFPIELLCSIRHVLLRESTEQSGVLPIYFVFVNIYVECSMNFETFISFDSKLGSVISEVITDYVQSNELEVPPIT